MEDPQENVLVHRARRSERPAGGLRASSVELAVFQCVLGWFIGVEPERIGPQEAQLSTTSSNSYSR